MDENNNSNNSNSYKTVSSFVSSQKIKSFSFSKNILCPFISGIVGTSLVLATCFGVPSIKEKLIGENNVSASSLVVDSSKDTSSSYQNINTTAISLTNYSDTAMAVADKILPSIVGIKVEYTVTSIFSHSSSSSATAEGSGIIISEDGYILTNNHIVNSSSSSYYSVTEASKVIVTLYNDETEYTGTIIGTDELTDLAVIKIEKTGLTAAKLGDSDSVKVGEFSMAVGNPLGLQSSITCGVISAINRKVTDSDGKEYTLIQTDAAINSGNSGGALVNSKGEVIGINTLKIAGSGIEGMGFAIPINSTINIYEQLIQYNKVKRPYIGISGRDIDSSMSNRYNLPIGVYVASVEDFSAAQKADIRIGDVIIKADGNTIQTMDDLNTIKNSHSIGDEITLTLYRNGNEINVTLTLGEQP